jgi:ribosomal protein S18 acetylase RimI-like enzyme
MTATIEVKLRQADDDDLSFLLALRRQTMTAHEAAVGKIRSAAEVQARVLGAFDAARIVLLHGVPVGMVKVVRAAREWELVQLQVAPEYQSRGIGSTLLRHLCAEARDAGADLTLSVLKSNPALRFYDRQGFSVVGESATAYKMRLVNFQR